MLRTLFKWISLFGIGGGLYAVIEVLCKGETHWSMFLLGGMMFFLIGAINEVYPWGMPLLLQGALGAILVTVGELVTGLVVNVWLGLGVWDYSRLPLNLWGQICLPFSLAWVVLSVAAVVLDDWLRHWMWHEERPHYTIWRWG